MSAPLLLFDVSNVCSTDFYACQGKSQPFDSMATTLYTFLRRVVSMGERFHTSNMAFCFDGPTSKREALAASYKWRRHSGEKLDAAKLETRRELKTQVRMLKGDLVELGFGNVWEEPGYEADDLLAAACHNIPGSHVVVSSDGDMWQLLSDSTVIMSPRQGAEPLTKEAFEAEWNFPADQWWKVKALAGCGTDEVVGVKGVGLKKAVAWFKGELPKHHAVYSLIKGSKALYDANVLLVKLPFEGTPVPELHADRITKDGFREVLSRYGLLGMADGDFGARWRRLFVNGGRSRLQVIEDAMKARRGGW